MKLQSIRDGNAIELHIPRSNFRKLWNWCLAHSEIGGVNVRVYWSSDYSVKQDKVARRIGRAVPHIKVSPRWSVSQNRYVVGYTNIFWSYVY